MAGVLALASVMALSAMLAIGGQQVQSAKALSYVIDDGESCLALPQAAKVQWDQRLSRCTV